MLERLPTAVFVIEVEGTLFGLRGLRRWFRDFGYFIEFSVGAAVRKAGKKPVFGNCIVAAVNRSVAKVTGFKRRAERTMEVVYQLEGMRTRRRIVCMHALRSPDVRTMSDQA